MPTETVQLDLKREEELTDKLLAYMRNQVKKMGRRINQVSFSFSTDAYALSLDKKFGEDYIEFKKYSNAQDDEIDAVIKSCIASEYISGGMHRLELTRQGWARANSNEKAKLYTSPVEKNSSYNFNGPVTLNNSQIGNNNQQQIHIENDIENLLKVIEASNASQNEKKEAKNLLLKFIEHPIVSSAINVTTATYIKSLFGG